MPSFVLLNQNTTYPSGRKSHLIEADANKVCFELNHRDANSNYWDAKINHRDARIYINYLQGHSACPGSGPVQYLHPSIGYYAGFWSVRSYQHLTQ